MLTFIFYPKLESIGIYTSRTLREYELNHTVSKIIWPQHIEKENYFKYRARSVSALRPACATCSGNHVGVSGGRIGLGLLGRLLQTWVKYFIKCLVSTNNHNSCSKNLYSTLCLLCWMDRYQKEYLLWSTGSVLIFYSKLVQQAVNIIKSKQQVSWILFIRKMTFPVSSFFT